MLRRLTLCFALAACNTPSPQMWGSEASQVQMRGHSFNIFLKDGRAEAVRTNRLKRRKLGEVYLAAALAMEKASGCQVIDRSFKGDPAQMWANLNCKEKPLKAVTCQFQDTHYRGRTDLVAVCENAKGERTVVSYNPPKQSLLGG